MTTPSKGRARNVAGMIAVVLLVLVWHHWVEASEAKEIRIKGSDTLVTVAEAWAKAYQPQAADVIITVHGGGSGNGIAALINGHVDMASTSRPMKARETRTLAQRTGVHPVGHIVGLDAVSVLVNKANPISGVSLDQLAEIYGKDGRYETWKDLGVRVPGCPEDTILRLGQRSNSGVYAFFKQAIFQKPTQYHSGTVAFRRADELVAKTSQSPCAIGYASMAMVTEDVKILCISESYPPGKSCVPPTAEFTRQKVYPLGRPLFLYTLDEPKGDIKAFLQWVQQAEGQEILRKSGFVTQGGE